MDVSQSTLSETAGRLERLGLLQRRKEAGISYYRVEDLELLHRLLTIIQPSLMDRLVDQFLHTWSD
jgi:DNA-binding transcriptional ArsR family regulator